MSISRPVVVKKIARPSQRRAAQIQTDHDAVVFALASLVVIPEGDLLLLSPVAAQSGCPIFAALLRLRWAFALRANRIYLPHPSDEQTYGVPYKVTGIGAPCSVTKL
jgi:hypothetical protein